MVQQTSKKASSSKSSKTTSSSSKVTSSESSSSSKAVEKKSGSQSSAKSSVVISEVHDASRDDGNAVTSTAQYVVTQPETAQKSKEHYIYGGTQIVEVSSVLGGDLFKEKNQSAWDGKFTYEGSPERKTTITTTTTKIVEPATSSTITEQTTKQSSSSSASFSTAAAQQQKLSENVSSTTNIKSDSESKKQSSIANVSNTKGDSSKLIHEEIGKKSDSKLSSRNKGNWDGSFVTEKTSAADATDYLLESERCIAKKAYVTTKKDDQAASSTSTKAVDNNISLKSMDSSKSHTKTDESSNISLKNLSSDYKSTTTKDKTTHIDGKHPTTTKNVSSPTKTSTRDNVLVDTRGLESFNEEFSQSFSSSSQIQSSSSSSKVVEIVDGKERVVSDTFNESGTSQSKSSQEQFKSVSGTGITPKVEYDQKIAEENIAYKRDKPDTAPIFDRKYMDSERNVKMTGTEAPVEYSKGTTETTRFDDKTHKYITDVQFQENNRQLKSDRLITDSVDTTKYGIETKLRDTDHFTSTVRNDQLIDAKTESQTFNKNLDVASTSQSNAFSNLYTSDSSATTTNISDSSSKYTSKVFDDKTNTWKVVNESSVNEKNVSSVDRLSKPRDRSPKKVDRIDARTKTSTTKTNEQNTILQQLYDEKTKSWREVDEKTIKSKRPSLIRYVSKDNEGKYTTIYKRKLFDKRSGTWKVVDEKIYKNNHFNEHIPEVIEDVTNVTTTTYTTKVFDNKTNTWKIVDEKTFTDQSTNVPKDIADELARDQPDIANITTTTELTKVMLFCVLSSSTTRSKNTHMKIDLRRVMHQTVLSWPHHFIHSFPFCSKFER